MSAQSTTNNYVAAIIFSDKAIFYLLSDSIMCSCSFIGYTCVGTVGSMEKLERFRVCLTAPAFMMYRRLDILGFCSVQRLFSRKAIYRTAPNYQSNLAVALFGLNIFDPIVLYTGYFQRAMCRSWVIRDSPAKHYFFAGGGVFTFSHPSIISFCKIFFKKIFSVPVLPHINAL